MNTKNRREAETRKRRGGGEATGGGVGGAITGGEGEREARTEEG